MYVFKCFAVCGVGLVLFVFNLNLTNAKFLKVEMISWKLLWGSWCIYKCSLSIMKTSVLKKSDSWDFKVLNYVIHIWKTLHTYQHKIEHDSRSL